MYLSYLMTQILSCESNELYVTLQTLSKNNVVTEICPG